MSATMTPMWPRVLMAGLTGAFISGIALGLLMIRMQLKHAQVLMSYKQDLEVDLKRSEALEQQERDKRILAARAILMALEIDEVRKDQDRRAELAGLLSEAAEALGVSEEEQPVRRALLKRASELNPKKKPGR